MESVLHQLFYGKLYPNEQCHCASGKYKELHSAYFKQCTAMEASLKEKDPTLFKSVDEIVDKYLDISALELEEMFIYSFRLGASMMLEILDGRENLGTR